jgi:23S rRNA (cytosine1962-C5)-methyltransferase
VDDYAFLDAGDGARLERFGERLVVRAHPGATGPRGDPGRWSDADLRFDRDRGWSGPGLDAASNDWVATLAGLALELRPTDAGHVGLFPEHAALVHWLEARVAGRITVRAGGPVTVLNLFAYTGLATLALARAGATVAHVDAARPSVAWARRNAARNALDERPIRWLVDDAHAFVAREARRGRRYDGVVLDPPTYGHGASGRAWRLERGLDGLLADVRSILEPTGFVLLTAHTEGLEPRELGDRLSGVVDGVEVGPLRLIAASGATLGLGAFARSRGAS